MPGTASAASANHIYPNHRPVPFNATLTVTAKSAAGEIKGTDTIQVTVAKGWRPGGTFNKAVGALSATGRALGNASIWLGIFSPFWLAALVAVYLINRMNRGRP